MMIIFAAVAFATATPAAAAQSAPAAGADHSRMHAEHAGRHCCCCCDGDGTRPHDDCREEHAPHADRGDHG